MLQRPLLLGLSWVASAPQDLNLNFVPYGLVPRLRISSFQLVKQGFCLLVVHITQHYFDPVDREGIERWMAFWNLLIPQNLTYHSV